MADWTLATMDWTPFVFMRPYWAGRQAAITPRPDSIMDQYRPDVQMTVEWR